MAEEFVYRRATVIALWSLLITGATYLFIFEPGKTGLYPVCIFRLLTGFTCPGCGCTRAMHQILHGHFLNAFMLNPLFLVAIPFLLFALIRYSVVVMSGGVPRQNSLPARYIYALFFVVVAFWIFRNTSVYPFVS